MVWLRHRFWRRRLPHRHSRKKTSRWGGGAPELDAAQAASTEVAPLAEGDVARNTGTGVGYATIDEAIDAASAGDTIELLEDVTATKTFSKSLTFTGEYTLKVDAYAWLYSGDLIFDGANFNMTSNPDSPVANQTEYQRWLGMSLSNGSIVARNGANVTFSFDSDSRSGTTNCAIYGTNADIIVESGSTFAIYGHNTRGVTGQGLQLDSPRTVGIKVTGGSTFLIDGSNRGYVCSPDIYVEDSTFTVQNCTANGSNGGLFTADNSTVTFQNNVGHGLSTSQLYIKDHSTVTSDNNGYYGVYASNAFEVDGTSTLNVTHNSDGGDFAGLKITSGVKGGKVEAGAVVNVTDNYCSGLSNNGELTFEEGAKLTITGNMNDKGTSSHGGGIYNSGASAKLVLPSDAVIYNNHAATDGDDIFNNTTSTITFPAVGSDWKLDGFGIDGVDDDCTDAIDGWYDDSANNRWEAHADIYDGIHVEKFTDSTTSVTGLAALKAAHGLGVVSVQPADITIYMGGDEGFEGVIDGSAQVTGSNSLPEPGFYFTLSDEINQAFENAGIAPVTEAADLSQYMTIYTNNKYTGEQLNWKLEKYGETNSVANNKFIYRIVPAPTEGQEAVPVRLQFTSEDGSQTFTNDTFDPTATDALYEQYTMQLYTELVNADQVVFEVEVPGKDNMPAQHFYNGMKLDTGKLTIRYVTGEQDDVVTGVVADIADAEQAGERAYAQVSESAKFFINGSDVDVTAAAAPSLLFDDVVSDYSTPGAESYDVQLAARAGDVVASEGTDMANPWYQAKYLDLVDANNGNVWLTSSEPVTVYWPYPEGTDQNTEFHLVHFQGLDREMGTADIESAIAGAQTEYVEVENTEHGVRFTTDGFSPFVLMWDAGEEAGDQPEPPVAGDKGDGSFAATGDGAGLAALAVLACVALAAAVTLAAGRRALGRG